MRLWTKSYTKLAGSRMSAIILHTVFFGTMGSPASISDIVRQRDGKVIEDARPPEAIEHVAFELIDLAGQVSDLAMGMGGLERWEEYCDLYLAPVLALTRPIVSLEVYCPLCKIFRSPREPKT